MSKLTSTMPLRLCLSANSLSIEQLKKFPKVYKAKKGALTTVKKQVRGKKGTHMQTFHVKVGEELDKKELSLNTVSKETIIGWKRGHNMQRFFNLVRPIVAKHYASANLKSARVSFDDALNAGYLQAHTELMKYVHDGPAKLSTMVWRAVRGRLLNLQRDQYRRVGRDVLDMSEDQSRIERIADTSALADSIVLRKEQQVIEQKQARLTKESLNNAVKNIIVAIKKKPVDHKQYVWMFTEWLNGRGYGDLGASLGVSRQSVVSKFKRTIFPLVVKLGFDPPQTIAQETKKKLKFLGKDKLKKAEGEEEQKQYDPGMMYIYKMLCQSLGLKPRININISGLAGERDKIRLDALKKLTKDISGRQ